MAERLQLDTASVSAMFSNEPVLSNVFWEVKTVSRSWDKALAVFLNSSLGILVRLATRNTTEGSWSGLKKADLKEMPVLDVRAIPES